jgi:hypothetical protein
LASRNARFLQPNEGGECLEAYLRIDCAALIEHRFAQTQEIEPTAAFPANGFGNAALLAFDDLFKTREAMRDRCSPISIPM